jgi:hypothetical protein
MMEIFPKLPRDNKYMQKMKIKVILFSCVIFTHLLSQPAYSQRHTPPPLPDVRPLIGTSYKNDKNKDKFEDKLFDRLEKAFEEERVAVTPETLQQARDKLDELVNVEFIFKERISQEDIDSFLARQGEITHIFKAVSYGWSGKIPLRKLKNIQSLMGPSLVLVEEAKPIMLHMRLATQTGRVRPVWASGFAGGLGYDGDSSISIAILDSGVDDSHTDLSGRQAYWHDYTADAESSPRDIVQHGTHVAGIALGSGASLGTGTRLYYTDSGNLINVQPGSFYPSVIDFPDNATRWSSVATWLGGGSGTLYHLYKDKGIFTNIYYGLSSRSGTSGVSLTTNNFTPLNTKTYSAALPSNGRISTYAVSNSLTNFSTVGDGFNTLRGVAPGCSWVGAKVFANNGSGNTLHINNAIDDIVAKRLTYNIKVMNLSLGITGSPGLSTSVRQKINTAAYNGILPVVSAGNDGYHGASSASQVDDPGRAAMALTIGASNDINELTDYTSHGFSNLGSVPGQEEDYKPDILAPGGSDYYSLIMSVDSNDADGGNMAFSDVQNNDYFNIKGTSMAAPFAAGSASLVIDALQTTGELTGTSWNFTSSDDVRLVKMLLSATATETNADREVNFGYDPTLERDTAGPDGYPVGKDKYEGYGILNVDAAIEGGTVYYPIGDTVNETMGGSYTARRAWARKVVLTAGKEYSFDLAVPETGDYDLYLYNTVPGPYGTPIIRFSSANTGIGIDESIFFIPDTDEELILVIKVIAGSGAFSLTSNAITTTVTLTLNTDGTGSGTVTGAGTYTYGNTATVNATPDTGSTLSGWSGSDAAECATGSVSMTENKSCTAIFTLNTHTLTLNTAGTGSGTVTGAGTYSYGDTATVTVTPDTGSTFAGWSGPDAAECNTGSVSMVTDKSCTATFNLVNNPPAFTSTAVTAATETLTYNYSITVEDTDIDDTLTIAATLKPPWLDLTDNGDGTALLSGIPPYDALGDYDVALSVTDNEGASDTQSFAITVAENIVSVDLDLSANWSLISLPVTPGNPNFTNLFPDAEVAYKFDGTYQLVTTLEPGVGYWVKLTTGGLYSITGRNFPQCNQTLAPGWNLVGGVSGIATPTTDPAGEIVVMYGFEEAYSEATEFVPGKGYWVKVNNGCELRVE